MQQTLKRRHFEYKNIGEIRVTSKRHINPFTPNQLAYPYKSDVSIPNFRGVRFYFFHFCPIFNRTSFEQTMKIQIRHRIMRCLI